MRLQKYLAQAGVASRRKCEVYIQEGKITVNGEVVKELGTQVEDNDKITFNGKEVKIKTEYVYYVLHKPVGYITTVSDEKNRPTVMELLGTIKERVFPVGRLDYNTGGLLLMTNDGALTYALTHPKHDIPKTYIAKVKGHVNARSIDKLCQGVRIEDYITSPAKVKRISEGGTTTTISITIHEGRNRQVRKMCEAIGHDVLSLKRVAMGPIKLEDLKEGTYRQLTSEEYKYLMDIVGKK
ncbi:MAG: pseudouridine synthase [Cellulosilyticaceae bacterium]